MRENGFAEVEKESGSEREGFKVGGKEEEGKEDQTRREREIKRTEREVGNQFEEKIGIEVKEE